MRGYVLITLRDDQATIEVGALEQDPYQLVRAWRHLPRPIRLALQASGIDALDFTRLVLALGRAPGPCQIRPGQGLEICLTQEEPASRPAPRVVIVRHPEWTGPRTTNEDVLHSP